MPNMEFPRGNPLDIARRMKQLLVRSALSPVSRPARRLRTALSYYREPLVQIGRWWFRSSEETNFTYELKERNQAYLAAFIAEVCHCPIEEIEKYMAELANDRELQAHVRKTASAHRQGMDAEARFGRRIGWYAAVRARKPKIVVETGVDKGLGTCVIAAALLRNAAEGRPGRVYATDLNPQAGALFREPYSGTGELLIGDSIESLRRLQGEIDIFINDSDHSADYERREYETIAAKLSPGALIFGDNAHVTTELLQFARRTARRFSFFREEPRDHWYPGGGIGAAY